MEAIEFQNKVEERPIPLNRVALIKVGIMYPEIRNLVYFGKTIEGRYEFVERLKSEKPRTSRIRSWIMDGYDIDGEILKPEGLYYSNIYRGGGKEHFERVEVWNKHVEKVA